MFELTTYAGVVHKAMIIEGESERALKKKEGKKRKGEVKKVLKVGRIFSIGLIRNLDFSLTETPISEYLILEVGTLGTVNLTLHHKGCKDL